MKDCSIIICFAIIVLFQVENCLSSAKGCVELDSITFDKVVPRFKYALVKFDIAFPYGDSHEAFTSVALELGPRVDNLLFALVGIKDYGELDNADLAKRFRVPELYPHIKLFHNETFDKFLTYPDDAKVTQELLRKYLRENTDLYIGLPGCLENFDELAIEFAISEDKDEIYQKAEAVRGNIDDEKAQNSAKVYCTIMKKILESDKTVNEFLHDEQKRLENLLKGAKLSENKKQDLNKRMNILESFKVKLIEKDEL